MIELPNLPSFVERPIRFPAREGFILTNASITVSRNTISAAVPAMDHYLDERGFIVPLPVGASEDDTRFARNLTYLVRLGADLSVVNAQEVKMLADEVPMLPWSFRGFECPRLFAWRGGMWVAACSCGTGAKPGSAFFRARIAASARNQRLVVCSFSEVQRLGDEKNWMPDVRGNDLRFHYRLGTLVSPDGSTAAPNPKYRHLHGGTQVIPYRNGGLCIVHEYLPLPDTNLKESRQYFALLDNAGAVQSISKPFTLAGSRLEVATGMAILPDDESLAISYGRDGTAPLPYQETPFIATMKLAELEKVL